MTSTNHISNSIQNVSSIGNATINLILYEAGDNKRVCDGLGCLSQANTVEEEIDGIGMIVLELCDDCVFKFRE
jgi:hypothetical protein